MGGLCLPWGLCTDFPFCTARLPSLWRDLGGAAGPSPVIHSGVGWDVTPLEKLLQAANDVPHPGHSAPGFHFTVSSRLLETSLGLYLLKCVWALFPTSLQIPCG